MGNKNVKNIDESNKSCIQISDFKEGQKLLGVISHFLITDYNLNHYKQNNDYLSNYSSNLIPKKNAYLFYSAPILPFSHLLSSWLLSSLNNKENNAGLYRTIFIPFIYEIDNLLEEECKFSNNLNDVLGEWNKHIPKYDLGLDFIFKSIELSDYVKDIQLTNLFKKALRGKVKKHTIHRKNIKRKTIKGYTILRRKYTKIKKKVKKKTTNNSKSNQDNEKDYSLKKLTNESKGNIIEKEDKENKIDKDDNNINKKFPKKNIEEKDSSLMKDDKGVSKSKSKIQIVLKENCLEKIIKRNQSLNKANFFHSKKVNSSFCNLKDRHEEKFKPFITSLKKKESFSKKSGFISPPLKKETKQHTLMIDIRQLENEDKVLFNFQNFNSKQSFFKQISETPKKSLDNMGNNQNTNYNLRTILEHNDVSKNDNITFFNKLKESTKLLKQNLEKNDKTSNNLQNVDRHKSVAFRLLNLSPNKDIEKDKVVKANSINNKLYLKKIMSSLKIDNTIKINNRFSTQNISENNSNIKGNKGKKIDKNESNISKFEFYKRIS